MGSIDAIRLSPPSHRGAVRVRFAGRISDLIASLAGLVRAMAERQASRKALAEMTDAQLSDIGLARREARAEAARGWLEGAPIAGLVRRSL